MTLAESAADAYRTIMQIRRSHIRTPIWRGLIQVLQRVSVRIFNRKEGHMLFWFGDGSSLKIWTYKKKARVMK